MLNINLSKIKKLSAIEFTRQDMIKVGARAVQSIQERVGKGLGTRDRPMRPLSASYRTKKTGMGQPGIRNLMFSGSMLGALTLVEVTNKKAVIGFTKRSEQAKAVANELRSPWYGLSKSDEQNVLNYADRLARSKTN